MTEKNVNLLQVKLASGSDEIIPNGISTSSAADVFIKCPPIKLPPVIHTDGENGVVQKASVEDAGFNLVSPHLELKCLCGSGSEEVLKKESVNKR